MGRREILALAAAASLATAGCATAASPRLEPVDVVTDKGRTRFMVEVVDNDVTRAQGLMFRKSLAPDRGMLFKFPAPREVAFWMRNTLIPLDIIYIKADGRVLSIVRNARPLDETPLPSGGPILGVLEVAGGRAAEIGLLPGDRIVHRMFPRE
jgi:uncharacterized membrane protein (UPF0127 family)